MITYKCLFCLDTGYVGFEKAVPEVYGDDHKVPFARPCMSCDSGKEIALKLENLGFWAKKAKYKQYIG